MTRVSTGAAAALVDVVVEVAPSAPADRPLPVRTTLSVKGDGPRVILHARGSALLLEHRGVVVASSEPESRPDVPLTLRTGASRRSQVLPDALVLRSCDGAALDPGDYSVRALVAYGANPLNSAGGGGPSGVLVSPAVAVVLA